MKVLVVDDHAHMRAILRSMLQTLPAEVREAGGGASALGALAQERFDVVLVDLQMRGLDGVALIKAIRRAAPPIHAATPIVVVSGDGTMRAVRAALAAGADDFIVKPLSADAVLARLLRSIARVSGGGPLDVWPLD